jgi:hypothetical protein
MKDARRSEECGAGQERARGFEPAFAEQRRKLSSCGDEGDEVNDG